MLKFFWLPVNDTHDLSYKNSRSCTFPAMQHVSCHAADIAHVFACTVVVNEFELIAIVYIWYDRIYFDSLLLWQSLRCDFGLYNLGASGEMTAWFTY